MVGFWRRRQGPSRLARPRPALVLRAGPAGTAADRGGRRLIAILSRSLATVEQRAGCLLLVGIAFKRLATCPTCKQGERGLQGYDGTEGLCPPARRTPDNPSPSRSGGGGGG